MTETSAWQQKQNLSGTIWNSEKGCQLSCKIVGLTMFFLEFKNRQRNASKKIKIKARRRQTLQQPKSKHQSTMPNNRRMKRNIKHSHCSTIMVLMKTIKTLTTRQSPWTKLSHVPSYWNTTMARLKISGRRLSMFRLAWKLPRLVSVSNSQYISSHLSMKRMIKLPVNSSITISNRYRRTWLFLKKRNIWRTPINSA